jgi:ligand-binding sensor domain-containing protein
MSSTGRGSYRNYFQRAYRRFGTLTVALVPILAAVALSIPFAVGTDVTPTASEVGDVWVADHRTAYRIDTDSSRITDRIPLPKEATALAVDPRDQALWVLTHKQLLKFDAATSLLFEVDLKDFVKDLPDPEALILNPYSGDVWVSAKKTLLRFDAQGRLLLAVALPEKIEAAALGLDESLWLLTKKDLRQIGAQGEIRATLALNNIDLKEPKHLAVDSLGGRVWIADKKRLWQLTAADLTAPPTRIALPFKSDEIEAIALDPLSGFLWVGTEEQLIAFNRAGAVQLTVDLKALKLDEPEVLAVDALRQHLWVGAKKKVVKFAFTGELLATIPVEKELEALALAPVAVLPQIALLQPAADALLNNATPTFRLALSARCNEIPCEAGDGYVQGFRFNATLNGEAVGDRFVISGTEAIFTPATRLPGE